MKTTLNIAVVLVMLMSIVSCNKKTRRNYQYMPNMYKSVGYEAYQESDAFKNGVEAQLPVEGTLPRGYSLYEIEDTTEGYEEAKANLTSPLDSTAIDLVRGKELYDIYCTICHGNKGAGNGYLGAENRELILPGSYATKELTNGSIYHVIYYGKNSMGSYANFMSEEERWQVVAYVEKLTADLKK